MSQRAGNAANHHLREVNQADGDPAAVHQRTGEDKERNRQQGKVVQAVSQALGDGNDGDIPREHQQHRGNSRDADRERNRHADKYQHKESAKQR